MCRFQIVQIVANHYDLVRRKPQLFCKIEQRIGVRLWTCRRVIADHDVVVVWRWFQNNAMDGLIQRVEAAIVK